MDKQKLGKLVGTRIMLKPPAKYFNTGHQVDLSYPDVWIVQRTTLEGICLENSNRISFTLPGDHVHHFSSEMPERDSQGTLLLTSQVRIDGYLLGRATSADLNTTEATQLDLIRRSMSAKEPGGGRLVELLQSVMDESGEEIRESLAE